jgi:UDP-GlcNAc:undecaprenyl-phosphate GlcNAc-1-phosphate transferase
VGRYLLIALTTFAVSAVLTAAVRRVGLLRGWLVLPRADRSHTQPTALFGGVAIFVALALGLLAFTPMSRPLPGLLALTTAMFSLGLADDLWDLRPQTKLVAQIAGGLLLYVLDFHFNANLPWLLDLAIVVLWVVGITNAMNLLDNMNGLCAGTAIIAAAFRWMLYVEDGNPTAAAATAVFLGAVLGFFVFNFPRASIFMGDAGSLVVGFFLAALNLTSGESYSKNLLSILFFPVMVLALPIFDTAFVSLVRSFSGRAVSQGGRDHTSHRLVAVGLSETAAVVILYGISIAGGTTAYALYRTGFSYAWFLAGLVVLGLTLFGVFLASVKVYPEDQVPWDAETRTKGRFSLVADFKYKRTVLWVLVDTLTILVAWYAAVLVRYGGTAAWPQELAWFIESAPVAIVTVLLGLQVRGLYRSDWHHFSLHEVRAIVTGAAVGLVAAFLIAGGLGGAAARPSLALIAFCATVLTLAGTRLFVRNLAELFLHEAHGSERVLVYGAGKGGELALRELRQNKELAKIPVGFIDDNPARRGMTMMGLPILGGLEEVPSLVQTHQIQGIVVSTVKLSSGRQAALGVVADAHGLHLYRMQIAVVRFDAPTQQPDGSQEVLRRLA